MSKEELFKEITKIFESCGKFYSKDKENQIWLSSFKNPRPKFRLYDVNSEKLKKEMTKFNQKISLLDELDQAKFYNYLFKKTDYYYLGHEAINHFKAKQKKKNPNLLRFWPMLKTWVTRIDNWAHADMLASLYCDIHTEDPKITVNEFKKWSKTKSPWKNRMAIVSLFYYYHPKRVKPKYSDVESIMNPHLASDHYYLQKAIGWCLREVSSAYPKEYKSFMNKHLNQISSTAFTTSVEKCDKKQKEVWKLKRKEYRRQK